MHSEMHHGQTTEWLELLWFGRVLFFVPAEHSVLPYYSQQRARGAVGQVPAWA